MTNGISYSRIREIFKGYISEIVTTLKNFGLRSLRSGDASAVTARQIDWYLNKVVGLLRKQEMVIIKDSVVNCLKYVSTIKGV